MKIVGWFYFTGISLWSVKEVFMISRKILIVIIILSIFVNCGKSRSKEYISAHKINGTIGFPKDFLWGTATAAEQIESTPDSNWFEFIVDAYKNKKFLTISPGEAKPGHINSLGNYPWEVIRVKTNHDEVFKEDISLMKEMGLNSYRFSFAWDRFFPKEGMNEPDPKAIAYYKKIIEELKEKNIKPSATLFHFSSPAWFWKEKNGKRGWEREDAIQQFSIFVKAVVKNFGKDVTHWCTLNEPMVFVAAGYMQGVHPPLEMRPDVAEVTQVIVAILKAHVAAYNIIKDNDKLLGQKSEVGFTQHTRDFEPYRNYAILDRIIADRIEQAFIWDFIDAFKTGKLKVSNTSFEEEIPGLKDSLDYLGINYYGRFYIESNILNPTKFKVHMNDPGDKFERINNLAWAHYPLGFYNILTKSYQRYRLPIYILENGTADSADDDILRQEILVTHIYEMWHAMNDAKVPIKGYYHWSLIDNFEWAEGFEAKFGLIKVDYKNNFKREKRKSADIYKSIIQNGITPELFEKYAGLYK
jgi:beta-glucosidase